MSFTGTVENDTIKLPPGVHLPDGTKVSIVPREQRRALESAAAAYTALLATHQAEAGWIEAWEAAPLARSPRRRHK